MQDDVYYEMPSKIVVELDKIIEEAHRVGSYERIDSETDWKIVRKLFLFWRRAYPTEYKHFLETMKLMKQGAMNKHAASVKEKGTGGAQVRHICEVPKRFGDWLSIFYPKQKYTKNFIRKLITKIPEFKVPETV